MTPQEIADSHEIKAAIEWWTARIGAGEFDNGDAGINALARMTLKMMPPPPEGAKERFANALKRSIADNATCFYLSLSVDYHPDRILAVACDAAGIGTGIGALPAKTTMWIKPGKVTVRTGYGAPEQTIFPVS